MSLWAWALAAWAKPGVERACLNLQDRGGQSVVLLLWGIWSTTDHRAPDPVSAGLAAELVRPIEIDLLRPLRIVRRTLAQLTPGLDDQTRQDAYTQVRGVEINLERALLEALEQQTAEQDREAVTDIAQSLQMLMETWSGKPLDDDGRSLARALVEALA